MCSLYVTINHLCKYCQCNWCSAPRPKGFQAPMKDGDYCRSVIIGHADRVDSPSKQPFTTNIKNYFNITVIALYTTLPPCVLH